MRSHSVTCHPAEVTFPPLPQPKLVLDLATPEGCKAELTWVVVRKGEGVITSCATLWIRLWKHIVHYLGWCIIRMIGCINGRTTRPDIVGSGVTGAEVGGGARASDACTLGALLIKLN